MTRLLLLLLLAAGSSASHAAAVPVTTAALGELLEQPQNSAPATVIARSSPSLSAEISARIEAIPVRVGDIVSAGELLVQLDCREYDSLLAAAAAGLQQLASERDFAAAQLRRAEGLKLKKGISDEGVEQRKSEWQSYVARYRMQEEAQRQARLQVERCRIRSPFKAVVVERLADSGSLATVGTPIVKIVQLDDIELSARLRQQEAASLQRSAAIWFHYLGERYALELRSIVPVIDALTRTREARLRFSGEAAPAGAAGRLLWQGGSPQLPASYLVRRGSELGLFYSEGGVARFHALPGAVEGQPAAVDLPLDTQLIVQGRQRLSDGDDISVAPQSGEPAQSAQRD
jgi:RND family efflux transporter MFP subunit